MTYPLGRSVVTQMVVRRERWPGGYKIRGIPLVYQGQDVQPDQPVIRIEKPERSEVMAELPRLSLPSSRPAPDSAEYGLLNGTDSNGKAQQYSQLSSINEMVPAGMRGRVIDITQRGGVIIESRAAVVQGAIGAGKQVAGVLTIWQARGKHSSQPPMPIPPGAILVIPGPLNFAMLRQALSSGVSGVVASSITSRDLEGFLRADLIGLLDSVDVEIAQAHLPPMTLLLTEGLGTLAMPARTINLLSQYQGSIALISGATSIRQRIFPELIISLPLSETLKNWHPVETDPVLAIGAQVRICGGDHEGAIGEVNYLFTHQQIFTSGLRSRAARLQLEEGSMIVVPMSIIERIG